jgi:hypothetical protein
LSERGFVSQAMVLLPPRDKGARRPVEPVLEAAFGEPSVRRASELGWPLKNSAICIDSIALSAPPASPASALERARGATFKPFAGDPAEIPAQNGCSERSKAPGHGDVRWTAYAVSKSPRRVGELFYPSLGIQRG